MMSRELAEKSSEEDIALSKQHDANGSEKINRPASRRKYEIFLGKLLIIATLVSFIFVGLLINLLQLILTCTIRLSQDRGWRRLHKRINGHLIYAIFAQPIFIFYSWSRVKLNVVLDDVGLIEDIRNDLLAIIIANHTYELDWMACFIMADQLGDMGSYKCFATDDVKYLPIIGWSFWMSDLVYVKRDWKEDKLSIDRKLDALLDYDQILLGIFAEGARWTEEKHRDSVEFARRRNMEPFKHHLFPKPRGFNYTLRHYLRREALEPETMAGKRVRVFNLEIILPDRLNFNDFLQGRQVRADIYCEEVELSDELRAETIESKDEDDCTELTKLLRDIFRRKDALQDEYEQNNHEFKLNERPNGGYYPIKRPIKPLIYWLVSMSLTYGSFTYMALTLFAESLTFWCCIMLLVASSMLLLKRIEYESKPTESRLKITKLM